MANFGRARTWTTGEKLTAVDLNAEFDNIINNVTSGGINADNIDLTDDYTWTGSHVFSGSGTTTQVQINNTATDGDSYLSFALSGTLVHSMGVDDGDSDKFKIGTTAIGTGTWFEKDSTTLTLSSLLTVGVNDTGYDVQFFGATAGAHMLWDESADTLKLVGAAKIDAQGTVTVGVNDTGFDVQLFGAASGAYSLWDESANTQVLRGATAAGAGTLLLQTAELTNVDGGILGRIDFQAPLDAAGIDAALVGASIWAEADDTFSSILNDTDLVFAVAESETALERMRLGYDGTNVELTFSGATTVSAGGAIVTVSDPIQHNATFTAGVDGTGYDFKLFGATSSAHLLWDESADDLKLVGAAGLTVAGTSALTVTTASTITASGVVSVDDVTDSTSGITGSIHTDGGLGVVKDIAGGNDLLLTSSGAIINFNSGDVLLTHSSNAVTVSGGTWATAALTSTTFTALGVVTVGVDDTGHDVVFHGATAGTELLWDESADQLVVTAGTYRQTAGNMYLGDSANAKMTIGLTINQGANDDEATAWKSSDVGHGITDEAETDTYGYVKKASAAGGGLQLGGFTSSQAPDYGAVALFGVLGEAANTAKTTGGYGVIRCIAAVKNVAARTSVGADGNLMSIDNFNIARFIFDAEGSGHADVEFTTFDQYDDIALINDIEQELVARESDAQTDRRLRLMETGIIGKDSFHVENGKTRAMVNFTKLAMLHHGAHIQTGERLDQLESQNALLLEELTSLKNRLN